MSITTRLIHIILILCAHLGTVTEICLQFTAIIFENHPTTQQNASLPSQSVY